MQKALPIISWSMALSQEMNTHFSLFTIRISGAAVKNYTTAVDKKYSHMLVHHVSCFSCYFFLTIWNSLNSLCKKKIKIDVMWGYKFFSTLKIESYNTLLNFSPSLWGIRDFKLWKPALMLCILRLSLLLAISLLIFFSFSIWALPGTDCDLQHKWKIK